MSEQKKGQFDLFPCRPSNMDRFYVRRSIVLALMQNLHRFSGKLLDLGSGEQPYRELILEDAEHVTEYCAIDIPSDTYVRKPDHFWDGNTIPLEDGSVQSVVLTEVLEHCPDPQNVLREIHRVLSPGGVLFFTIPFLWPLHDVPYDVARYTPFTLQRFLEDAGFAEESCRLWPLGGTDAAVATALGLWVNRRPMPAAVRVVLRILLYPLVRGLIVLNGRRRAGFEHDELLTGIAGLATK